MNLQTDSLTWAGRGLIEFKTTKSLLLLQFLSSTKKVLVTSFSLKLVVLILSACYISEWKEVRPGSKSNDDPLNEFTS